MKKKLRRALVETGFIIVLFYCNLLMSEFSRTGQGNKYGFFWALWNVVTPANIVIAVVGAFFCHLVFESLRTRGAE